jgi:hypothetical protein
MNIELHHYIETNVAYIDVCLAESTGVRVDVLDVTQRLGLKTQVLARMDENGELLGLVIEDYSSFKRELRRKYLTFAIERILDLIVSKVRDFTSRSADCNEHHRLAAHA